MGGLSYMDRMIVCATACAAHDVATKKAAKDAAYIELAEARC